MLTHITTAQLHRAVAAIDRLEFDHPFRLSETAEVSTPEHDDVHAPDHVAHDDDADVLIDGGCSEWVALTGLTGQHGYSGAVMHSSEVMSPGVVSAMLTAQESESEPQLWALVVVGVDECDDEPAGWTIVHRDDPTVRLYDHQAEDAYAEWLNDVYGTVSVAGADYDTGGLLRMADPVTFRCGLADWADSEGIEII